MEDEAGAEDAGNDGESGTGTAIVMAASPPKRRNAAGVVRALGGFTGASNTSSTALACESGRPLIRGAIKSAANRAACTISTTAKAAKRETVQCFDSFMVSLAIASVGPDKMDQFRSPGFLSALRCRRIRRQVTLHKFEYALIEHIVLVAGDHVTGATYIEDFQLRQVGAEIRYRRFRNDVALQASDKQCRNAHSLGCTVQPLGEQRRLGVPHLLQHARIPMPIQATIDAQSQIFHEARITLRSRTMRVVGRDRVGRFLESAESLRTAAHEAANLGGAAGIDARHNVHKDQCRGQRLSVRAGHQQRRGAAHGGTHQRRSRLQSSDDALQILGQDFEGIIAVRGPLTVAVAARIEVDHVVAAKHQLSHRAAPRVACLAAAMQQYDGWRSRVASDIGGEFDALCADIALRHERARQSEIPSAFDVSTPSIPSGVWSSSVSRRSVSPSAAGTRARARAPSVVRRMTTP